MLSDKGKNTLKANNGVKNPRKAMLMSVILPGLGQAYNEKYWKIPIIYGGFGTLIYFIDFNSVNYKKYKRAYLNRIDNGGVVDEYINYTNNDLLELKNYYRKNLELTYILTGVLYFLNIIDANVDAYMSSYDVSDDISFRMDGYQTNQMVGGIKLTLSIRL